MLELKAAEGQSPTSVSRPESERMPSGVPLQEAMRNGLLKLFACQALSASAQCTSVRGLLVKRPEVRDPIAPDSALKRGEVRMPGRAEILCIAASTQTRMREYQARLRPILRHDGMAFFRGSEDTSNSTRSVLKSVGIAPNLSGLYTR